MTLYNEYRKIGDEIAKKIAKCPKIKAVAYIGSMANGFVDKISKDIDLVCIVNKLPSIKERRSYLGNYEYSKNATLYMEMLKIKDVKIDIVFKELGWFERVLRKMVPEDEFNEKQILHLIQNAKIIVDKNNIFKNMKRKVRYTHTYRTRKLEFLFHVLCNRKFIIAKPLKRKNMAFVDYLFSDSLEKYVAMIFALNKKYYSDLKWVEKYIESFKIKPKGAIKNLRRISELGNKPNEIDEKLDLLKEMLLDISKIIKREVPKANIDESLKKLSDW